MNKEDALAILNLRQATDREQIERSYSRLVRRYPPEFHPDKFRQVDEAYRFLTSFPFRLEKLLSPEKEQCRFNRERLAFVVEPPSATLQQALSELKKGLRTAHLWPSPAKD